VEQAMSSIVASLTTAVYGYDPLSVKLAFQNQIMRDCLACFALRSTTALSVVSQNVSLRSGWYSS